MKGCIFRWDITISYQRTHLFPCFPEFISSYSANSLQHDSLGYSEFCNTFKLETRSFWTLFTHWAFSENSYEKKTLLPLKVYGFSMILGVGDRGSLINSKLVNIESKFSLIVDIKSLNTNARFVFSTWNLTSVQYLILGLFFAQIWF